MGLPLCELYPTGSCSDVYSRLLFLRGCLELESLLVTILCTHHEDKALVFIFSLYFGIVSRRATICRFATYLKSGQDRHMASQFIDPAKELPSLDISPSRLPLQGASTDPAKSHAVLRACLRTEDNLCILLSSKPTRAFHIQRPPTPYTARRLHQSQIEPTLCLC